MSRRQYRDKPDWLFECEVGDVFVEGRSGTLRVLRAMTTNHAGMLMYGTFAIRRPSWAGRCYTVLTYSGMLTRDFRPVGARAPMGTVLGFAIEAAIHQPASHRYVLTANDVRGVA